VTGASEELGRIERYYDTVPRAFTTVEAIGPFTLFVSQGHSSYYARPQLGYEAAITPGDIAAVRARQRELGVAQTFEWSEWVTPTLAEVARAAGLEIHRHPLMVLREPQPAPLPAGYRLRVLDPDDPALPAAVAAINVGFATPGTAVAAGGPRERDATVRRDDPGNALTREKLRRQLMGMVVVEDDSGPVAGGSHSPRDRVSEITGVATLPAQRRRGLGAAVAAALVGDAHRAGVDLCFLTADSEAVARVYARVGFTQVGTACTAVGAGP